MGTTATYLRLPDEVAAAIRRKVEERRRLGEDTTLTSYIVGVLARDALGPDYIVPTRPPGRPKATPGRAKPRAGG